MIAQPRDRSTRLSMVASTGIPASKCTGRWFACCAWFPTRSTAQRSWRPSTPIFPPQNLQQEAAYLRAHPGFERPYGWGWALMLAHEAADWQDETARAWAVALTPLAETITDLMLAWLPKATYPTRDGMHSNSAFGLARSLPWARHLARQGNPRLLDAIRETALRWYQHDENYPANWEPSGADFLSPALTEAE